MKRSSIVIGVMMLASQAAFAGNGPSGMRHNDHQPPPFTRMDHRTHQPTPHIVFTREIMQAITQAIPPTPVVVIPPPVDLAAQALTNLTSAYTNFLALQTQAITDAEADSFVTSVATILIRYPQHIPTAKSYFTNESRIVYKILFAGIIYIADQNDQDALNYLNSNNTTQKEFADMDKCRSNLQTAGLASISGGSGSNPFASIVSRFINGR